MAEPAMFLTERKNSETNIVGGQWELPVVLSLNVTVTGKVAILYIPRVSGMVRNIFGKTVVATYYAANILDERR